MYSIKKIFQTVSDVLAAISSLLCKKNKNKIKYQQNPVFCKNDKLIWLVKFVLRSPQLSTLGKINSVSAKCTNITNFFTHKYEAMRIKY